MARTKSTRRIPKQDKFMQELKEVQKDSEFRRDIRKFIKATTSVYKL